MGDDREGEATSLMLTLHACIWAKLGLGVPGRIRRKVYWSSPNVGLRNQAVGSNDSKSEGRLAQSWQVRRRWEQYSSCKKKMPPLASWRPGKANICMWAVCPIPRSHPPAINSNLTVNIALGIHKSPECTRGPAEQGQLNMCRVPVNLNA